MDALYRVPISLLQSAPVSELEDNGGVTLAGQFCYRGRVFTWAETLFIIEIPKNDQCKNGFWVPWWIDCDPDYLFVFLKSLWNFSNFESAAYFIYCKNNSQVPGFLVPNLREMTSFELCQGIQALSVTLRE